ncbi:MAG: tetratricopeptide repeat protein [Alphaproteobacteria bacterium]|jgi:tetratricopeptide (TPR) repeat protein|nr:tetratricopeptide repeat protein [Alphaproteobacteria bacterium]HJP20808.1 tetratricopeptide repeat protein [Alphaproteobacteria bacterium]
MNITILAPILALALTFSWPTAADQADPRLDELFARLKEAPEGHEAAMVSRLIWTIWTHSDSPTVDLLMERSGRAMAAGKHQAALGDLTVVVELAPKFAEGWNRRATLHYMMGNYPRSIEDVHQTLELEPRHFGALSGLGMIYRALEQPRKAINAFRRALATNPHLSQARASLKALLVEIEKNKI